MESLESSERLQAAFSIHFHKWKISIKFWGASSFNVFEQNEKKRSKGTQTNVNKTRDSKAENIYALK